jgi:hypothetical protein
MIRRSPTLLLVAVLACVPAVLLACLPAALPGQTAEVAVAEENFRLEPMGKRLATVNRGTRVQVRGSQGRWRQVTLEGWIWAPSVSSSDRPGYDVVVSADGGENLRVEPDPGARVAARLLEGFLLQRIRERGDWIRVRRTAWMWAPSLRIAGEGGGPADAAAGGGEGAGGAGAGGGQGGDGEAGDGAEPPSDRLVVEERPASLFVSPDGDTLAVARPGTDLTVLAREGEWARVRMEGWVRTSGLVRPDSASATGELSLSDLKANPGEYEGRRVRWTVQFISLERAEPERTDFYEGEPFILARPTGGGQGFVYIAVPPERVSRVEELRPLQRIQVVGRVRTGRSKLMGAPVLDLVELRPRQGGG